MEQEIWRDVQEEGFEGLYIISNLGCVKRKFCYHSRGNYYTEGKVSKGHIGNEGYLRFSLINGPKIKNLGMNVLVAKAFPEICGEWFEGCEVHHLNHNKTDNQASNLIVMSPKKHRQYHLESYLTHLNKSTKIAKYDLNYNLIQIYNSVKECMEDNNICEHTMCRYLKGKYGFSKYRYIKLE